MSQIDLTCVAAGQRTLLIHYREGLECLRRRQKSIGHAYNWKEIYVSNLQKVFTETCLKDADRTKTLPCKYFFKMERGNPSQELTVNYANR